HPHRGPRLMARPGAQAAPPKSAGVPPPSRVVVTAGHVDHGKSTLVEWITGTHPDRLEEERRRGLTIDLGFASTVLPSGIEIGVVDVPGHVRFLKNMVAGVGAVDACLFVVAATEGWKPQTEDHLRILEAVGVRHGIVVLTHTASVGADRLDAVRREIAARVSGTFLQGARVVAVDVPGGVGLAGPGGLQESLDAMIVGLHPPPDRDRPRLWIDRSFAIRGAGAVVTGTLAGGAIAVGDQLDIVSSMITTPLQVRVRGLESYGRRLTSADPGRRLAVNLAGVDRRAAARGSALLRARQWHRCRVADASLAVRPGLDHPVSARGAYLAHLGTGEQAVRLRAIGQSEIAPGSTGTVRLWLTAPLPLAPGDRYVLRDAGRTQVIGGGTLLDVAPCLPVSKAEPSISVARVVAERGWVEAEELERLTGAPATATVGRWVVDVAALERARSEVSARVRAAGASGLDLSVFDERERAVAATIDDLTVSHGIARVADVPTAGPGAEGKPLGPQEGAGGWTADRSGPSDRLETVPAADADLLDHPYLALLRETPFDPPPPTGVARNDLRRLVRSGLVVETNGLWFAASAVEEAAARVSALLQRNPDGVRVSDVRDALGASRRTVLPMLSHLDATGVTRRNGDLRTPGPKLPPALAEGSHARSTA
ncbi:MAG TPA: SelB C-terminal domain-containing protein, partial [Acidimicrobiales bacterium]|nr:SelB C-terminal domain-containing protein [Acidimicrobiales bacterium]